MNGSNVLTIVSSMEKLIPTTREMLALDRWIGKFEATMFFSEGKTLVLQDLHDLRWVLG